MRFQDIPQLYRANYKVAIPWDYLEDWLARVGADYGLELEPDFQRAHVWTKQKRIDYVEYILAGGPSAREIQWNCYHWDELLTKPGPMILVDGQHVTSVRMFLANQLPAYGYCLKEYDSKLSFHEHTFTFFVNNLPTRAHVLRWYLQLNAGGVVHTRRELDRVRNILDKEKLHG